MRGRFRRAGSPVPVAGSRRTPEMETLARALPPSGVITLAAVATVVLWAAIGGAPVEGSAGDAQASAGGDGSWFTRAFEGNSILWLVIASAIGGVIGATVKFIFDDLASPLLSRRFQERRVFRSYLPGLLKDAEAAEHRLTLLVNTVDLHWYDDEDDDYFRLYTLYQLGSFLARVHVIEREVGFLPAAGAGRRSPGRFNENLYGPFNGLTSFTPFAEDYSLTELDQSQVPRGMLKAVGEAMATDDETPRPIDFTVFVERYDTPDFQRWFVELDELLRDQGPAKGSGWDRLIVAAAEFRLLARVLDPKGRMVGLRQPANLNKLNSASAREFVEQRWNDVTRKPIEHEAPASVPAEES